MDAEEVRVRLRATFGVDVCMQPSIGYSAGRRIAWPWRPTLFALTMQRRVVPRSPARRREAPAMTHTPTPPPTPQREQSIGVPVLWGLAFGAIQAASPLALRWLDQATVQALLLAAIAAVYVGFAVADGRPTVIAVECTIAGAFALLAAAGVTGSAWLLVLGYTGHGLKDFWQERRHYVANTRWWPPFCAAVDWLVAVVLVIEIITGAGFHR
jgi:hypothetical protein